MRRLYRALVLPYHYAWAFFSALRYGFPARRLTVIGVTGTKGKSSVAEILHAILSEDGKKTALAGTIRFAYGDESRPNLYKMTVPGRGFMQKFLAEAVRKNCTHAITELTSEGAVHYRHAFLALDALIFTNLQKEHIESHGSLENYFRAKFRIARALLGSPKRPRAIIANADDARGKDFLSLPVEDRIPFSFADAGETTLALHGVSFHYRGTRITLPQPGRHNVMNALAALAAADWLGVSLEVCASALAKLSRIPGRAERVDAGQDFLTIVDYAHTPDSLSALYDAYKDARKICVLGSTGGGRDRWKRPVMGRIAERHCAEVFLTDEDPYDEDPRKIVEEMAAGMSAAGIARGGTVRRIMDRRSAIRAALRAARPGDAVLISGKGTDPFIMRTRGAKEPWSDAQVAREELEQLALHARH